MDNVDEMESLAEFCVCLQDVAAFLEEMDTTEVLLDAVLKSQNARVTVSDDKDFFYLYLLWVTKTEFLLTISIQYEADK